MLATTAPPFSQEGTVLCVRTTVSTVARCPTQHGSGTSDSGKTVASQTGRLSTHLETTTGMVQAQCNRTQFKCPYSDRISVFDFIIDDSQVEPVVKFVGVEVMQYVSCS